MFIITLTNLYNLCLKNDAKNNWKEKVLWSKPHGFCGESYKAIYDRKLQLYSHIISNFLICGQSYKVRYDYNLQFLSCTTDYKFAHFMALDASFEIVKCCRQATTFFLTFFKQLLIDSVAF